jgi:hypothetical protein
MEVVPPAAMTPASTGDARFKQLPERHRLTPVGTDAIELEGDVGSGRMRVLGRVRFWVRRPEEGDAKRTEAEKALVPKVDEAYVYVTNLQNYSRVRGSVGDIYKGVGRALLTAVEERGRAAGATRIVLQSEPRPERRNDPNSTQLERFDLDGEYRRNGFQHVRDHSNGAWFAKPIPH